MNFCIHFVWILLASTVQSAPLADKDLLFRKQVYKLNLNQTFLQSDNELIKFSLMNENEICDKSAALITIVRLCSKLNKDSATKECSSNSLKPD